MAGMKNMESHIPGKPCDEASQNIAPVIAYGCQGNGAISGNKIDSCFQVPMVTHLLLFAYDNAIHTTGTISSCIASSHLAFLLAIGFIRFSWLDILGL